MVDRIVTAAIFFSSLKSRIGFTIWKYYLYNMCFMKLFRPKERALFQDISIIRVQLELTSIHVPPTSCRAAHVQYTLRTKYSTKKSKLIGFDFLFMMITSDYIRYDVPPPPGSPPSSPSSWTPDASE